MRSLALRLPGGFTIDGHEHPWAQLVYAIEGVMRVSTPTGTWVVPSHRAVWVPGGTRHELLAASRVLLRTLYVRPDLARDLPDHCRVTSVSALLRELVLAIVHTGMLRDCVPAEQHLAAVLLDQIRATDEVPLRLPWPADARARRVADRVLADLAGDSPLAELADGTGASPRTLERLFARETRMTFGSWRQRARLLHSLQLLAAGDSVTSTAMSVGFASTSAFVSMFRRAMGTTPGRYFHDEPDAAAPHVNGSGSRRSPS